MVDVLGWLHELFLNGKNLIEKQLALHIATKKQADFPFRTIVAADVDTGFSALVHHNFINLVYRYAEQNIKHWNKVFVVVLALFSLFRTKAALVSRNIEISFEELRMAIRLVRHGTLLDFALEIFVQRLD